MISGQKEKNITQLDFSDNFIPHWIRPLMFQVAFFHWFGWYSVPLIQRHPCSIILGGNPADPGKSTTNLSKCYWADIVWWVVLSEAFSKNIKLICITDSYIARVRKCFSGERGQIFTRFEALMLIYNIISIRQCQKDFVFTQFPWEVEL